MSKVLLLGVGPLPIDNPPRLYAPGLRLWIFATALAKNSHDVFLTYAGFEKNDSDTFSDIANPTPVRDHIVRFAAPVNFNKTPVYIRKICDEYSIDCIVSSTDVMNKIASLSNAPVPKWCDFFGHPMAEAQMVGKVYDNNEQLLIQWLNLVPELMVGDRFSVCSQAQKYALAAELGVCGRLNSYNASTDLISVIPPSFAFPEFKHTKDVAKGVVCPEDSFIVLWSGGYNTWCDVKTLFDGLTLAMQKYPDIYFVSTGGAIKGHNPKTFKEFKDLINHSPLKERFRFVGWVPTEDVQNYYLEADVGINVDCFSYEGVFGTRNRILEWLQAGLPIVSTDLCELSSVLARNEMIHTFPIGDSASMAGKIISLHENKKGAIVKAERARAFAMEEFSPEKTTKPLVEWVGNPTHAPDNAHALKQGLPKTQIGSYATNALSELHVHALATDKTIKDLKEHIKETESQLDKLRGKKVFRVYRKAKEKFPFLFKKDE